MWLRFIDAKARPLDLMDLKLAYLDSGDGGKYFKSERERASRIWKHCSYRHSDFYDVIPLLMSSIESYLSNKPKQCILKIK